MDIINYNFINGIFSKFDIPLPNQVKKEIVSKSLVIIEVNNFTTSEKITEVFEHNIRKILNIYLNNSDNYNIVREYIEKNLSVTNDYKNIRKEFYKLYSWFNKLGVKPEFDLLLLLIKTKEIELYLDLIVSSKSNLSFVTHDVFISELIQLYCNEKNIELNIEDNTDQNLKADESYKIYISEVAKYPLLSAKEERELAIKVANGDREAKELFINSNLRLVLFATKSYMSLCSFGISLEDLIQDGNIGLMKAVEKFDYNKECKFSTYAMWWIRQSISRSIIDTSSNIRIPVYKSDKLKKIMNISKIYLKEHGVEPTFAEIASLTGMSEDLIKELLNLPTANISLNEYVSNNNGDESVTYEYFLADPTNIEEFYETKILKDDIINITKVLTQRELAVIALRYGLSIGEYSTNGEILSLQEIGTRLGITRERVRQIQRNALEKMKTKNKKYYKIYDKYN